MDCIRCGLCERYCPDLAIEVLPKRDAAGNLPPETLAAEGGEDQHGHVPEAARGPAIAGTDPHRGLTDTESAEQTNRDSEA